MSVGRELAVIGPKKLLVADMESTIIEQEMLDELASDLGHGRETADITRRAMNGELDFATALYERVALLKGQPVSILERAAKRITFMSGAEKLLSVMKAHGAVCWLVTGGFGYFAEPVAQKLGFDKVFANDLIVHDDVLTGEVVEPILDKNTKKELLERACKELGLSMTDCLAVGDGANDIPMLTACNEGGGLGVAYHAKPKVREVVPHQINHGDLTTLLYAQGYSV
jgi:phosphoserine phosphatase